MKKVLLLAIALLLTQVAVSQAQVTPVENLGQFFTANNIEYFTVPNFVGSGGALDYVFIPTRDPQDHETIGVFFELNAGNALNDPNMHWAIGLRGPRPGSPLPDHYGGRGLALGHLSSFNSCTGVGGFIEDFTAGELGGNNQLTTCIDEPIRNYENYRIDIHVSKTNVYVQIWNKRTLPSIGTYYQKIADYSCQGPCYENAIDENYGGVFIGSAFLGSGFTWSARNIHVAFF